MKPVSVSQLNAYIKRILQGDPLLGDVSVTGEISNLKYHGSGHVYFTLKDQSSRLNCFLAADRVPGLRHQLDDGMEITAAGYVSLYERGGSYSLNIRAIDVEGRGNLAIAFEKLRDKLAREGLFDDKYKKPLPAFPRQVAVITSETGAAVRDIVKIIRGRTRLADVLIYPCLVQGPEAGADIAGALEAVNRLFPETDLIILGRGGGSAEELWAFNEEIVARSIFLSEIPVISAVGHETDFTIADFVADRRAETPTAAAQMAVPVQRELQEEAAAAMQALRDALAQALLKKEGRVLRCNMDALRLSLLDRVRAADFRIRQTRREMSFSAEKRFLSLEGRMKDALTLLEARDPRRVLERGFAALTDEKGRLLPSASLVSPGDALTVILKDGKLLCTANEVRRDAYGDEKRNAQL
ncbi:MAG: exodeoxyribonuclease VII large subunit [Bacillota bacterium]|nr:exodeoxyribonuclease VII large subunit [Bacillota bacterium]